MSFDHNNLERLREIKRKLPQRISTNTSNSEKKNIKKTVENNHNHKEISPEELFKEFMRISPDGNIPAHLISELKEVEMKEAENQISANYDDSGKDFSNSNREVLKGRTKPIDNNNKKRMKNEQNLYVSFERLLLEEEEEDSL